jgi:RimJ/RimL family protein N-acetyltransferase
VITLRPVASQDLEAVRRVFADPEWSQWFGAGHSAEEHLARARAEWSDRKAAWFPICDVGCDDYLGEVAVRLDELGRANVEYWLLPEGRGRGRATRAVPLVSTWSFGAMNVARLQLWTEPANTASQPEALAPETPTSG